MNGSGGRECPEEIGPIGHSYRPNAPGRSERRAWSALGERGVLAVAQGIIEARARVEVSLEIERRLLAAGRPDFVDKLGRHWPLDRYAEMVARTTTRGR